MESEIWLMRELVELKIEFFKLFVNCNLRWFVSVCMRGWKSWNSWKYSHYNETWSFRSHLCMKQHLSHPWNLFLLQMFDVFFFFFHFEWFWFKKIMLFSVASWSRFAETEKGCGHISHGSNIKLEKWSRISAIKMHDSNNFPSLFSFCCLMKSYANKEHLTREKLKRIPVVT